VTTFGSY